MGGGGFLILDTLVFDEGQITCPTNGLHPKWNGLCHGITLNAGRTVVVIRDQKMSYQKVTGTLNPGGHPGSYNGQDAYNDMLITEEAMGNNTAEQNLERTTGMTQVVRRLTPLECTRLQGFPDGWVDIGDWIDDKGKVRKEADSPKYKALGNSIALPYWKVLLKRISAQYDRDATLGSLFSGIGGFDLCWAKINGPENVRWSSEIEPFPIAVMKKHFGDEDTGEPGDYYEAIQGSHKKC